MERRVRECCDSGRGGGEEGRRAEDEENPTGRWGVAAEEGRVSRAGVDSRRGRAAGDGGGAVRGRLDGTRCPWQAMATARSSNG